MKRLAAAIAVLAAVACRTAPAPQPKVDDQLHGLASLYGQEYAGRATANGEIFDPWQLTAAHRTLPFGTVVDVRTVKSGDMVRVRINDRGPYIHDRMIDLSYAAAAKIGLVEPGTGEVDLTIVRVGRGDREPPAPVVVTVPDIKPVPAPNTATVAEVSPPPPAPTVAEIPVVVAEVRPRDTSTIETRRQVSADGRRIETVPVAEQKPAPVVAQPQPQPQPATRPAPRVSRAGNFIVQVGAFAQESNAKMLRDQIVRLGENAYIDHGQLFHVRMGPFSTREEAIRMRSRLETAGLSAIVLTQ
jgi:rare lipoprotein A